MKLKCNDHDRRVMVLEGTKTIHRSDGTVCHSELLTLGQFIDGYNGKPLYPYELAPVRLYWMRKPKTPTWSPEMQLLQDIFGA